MTHGDHANTHLHGLYPFNDSFRFICSSACHEMPDAAAIPNMLTCFPPSDNCCRPHAPKECQRQMEPPELLMTACSRHCKNGHCTPTGKCCCSPGWEGPLCRDGECFSVDSHVLLSKRYHTDTSQGPLTNLYRVFKKLRFLNQ